MSGGGRGRAEDYAHAPQPTDGPWEPGTVSGGGRGRGRDEGPGTASGRSRAEELGTASVSGRGGGALPR